MEPRTNRYIAEACEGGLVRGVPDGTVCRLCSDSRTAQPGDVFFAIRGDRFDGHDFISDVASKGVATLVVDHGRQPVNPGSAAVIVVENTRAALGKLALRYRADFNPPMIAVAGSNGKTSTKQMVAAVLATRLRVLASASSFNNDIGVPTTLLDLNSEHQAAVLEVGTNHPGELQPLVKMVAPTLGILTSIGREHLEFFGSMETVAQEEGMLAEGLPAGGKLFITADSEWTPAVTARAKATVVTVGVSEDAHWRAKAFRVSRNGTSFRVDSPKPDYAGDFKIPFIGRHQAVNAVFAIAVGAELGLTRQEIQQGLTSAEPAKMRLQLWEAGGIQVLDDAYNANADSMKAALVTLKELSCKGRRIAVLGDMAELGSHSEAAHEEVGRTVAELGIDQLFAVGRMAAVTARGARSAGLNRVMEFSDTSAAAVAVRSFMRNGDLLLLKASRSSRLETLGEMLRTPENGRRVA